LKLEDRVTFIGASWGQELVDLYAGARAVYYAPFDEDFGLVTPEAFRSYKPIITTTDSGGPLEFVTDEETGCVTGPEPEAIAHSINRLMADEKYCKFLGNAGYERVKFISWDYVIENLVGAA
jgi:glycosyltransferase involved in cell wall biosynthesis